MADTRSNHAAVDKLGRVGNRVDVSLLAQVAGKRSDVTRLDYRFESDVLLKAQFEVIGGNRFRIDFQRSERTWENQSRHAAESVDVAIKDREGGLLGRICPQRTRTGAAG